MIPAPPPSAIRDNSGQAVGAPVPMLKTQAAARIHGTGVGRAQTRVRTHHVGNIQ